MEFYQGVEFVLMLLSVGLQVVTFIQERKRDKV